MKMTGIKTACFAAFAALLVSCSSGTKEETTSITTAPVEEPAAPATDDGAPAYDPKRGEGQYDETNVKLSALDGAMATEGEAIAGTKCTSCHKLTDEKLVGPGWKGVTTRRTPYWIMNFISNPDPMIDKDPEVQAQLELCLVRMPNQGLEGDDARKIVEFMRKNDGVK